MVLTRQQKQVCTHTPRLTTTSPDTLAKSLLVAMALGGRTSCTDGVFVFLVFPGSTGSLKNLLVDRDRRVDDPRVRSCLEYFKVVNKRSNCVMMNSMCWKWPRNPLKALRATFIKALRSLQFFHLGLVPLCISNTHKLQKGAGGFLQWQKN